MSANKDYRPILDKLRADGWSIDPTANGHMRAAPPDKSLPIVHFALSNEPRALRNTLADLRRSGFTWDEEEGKDEPAEALGDDEPETLDDLFSKLKNAREYLELAKAHAAETYEAAAKARAVADLAEEERASAEKTLRRVKERFDRAFGGG